MNGDEDDSIAMDEESTGAYDAYHFVENSAPDEAVVLFSVKQLNMEGGNFGTKIWQLKFGGSSGIYIYPLRRSVLRVLIG